jgi:phage shock protein A
MGRLWLLIKAKFSKLLDNAENPLETLDYSYEQQRGVLREVNRGLVEVVASKKRIEFQVKQAEAQISKLDEQAKAALAQGREDLARAALERKGGLLADKESLEASQAQLEAQQEKLEESQREFASRIESFRAEKEVIKAKYRAGEAQVAIGEAVTGLGKNMAATGLAIQRAKEKTEQMQARAAAVNELIEAGALTDQLGSGESKIDRALRELSERTSVTKELEEMKASLDQGTQGDDLKALGEGLGEGRGEPINVLDLSADKPAQSN